MLKISFAVDQQGDVIPSPAQCSSLCEQYAAYLKARRKLALARRAVVEHFASKAVTTGDALDESTDAMVAMNYFYVLRSALWARSHCQVASLTVQSGVALSPLEAESAIRAQLNRAQAIDDIVMARIIDCAVNFPLRSLWSKARALAATGTTRGVVYGFGFGDFALPHLAFSCEDRPPRVGGELGSLQLVQREMVEFLARLGLRPTFEGSGGWQRALVMDLPPAVSQSGWAPLKQIRVLGRVVY